MDVTTPPVLLYNPNAGRRGFSPAIPTGRRSDALEPLWLEAALSYLRVRLGRTVETAKCTSFAAAREAAMTAAAAGTELVIAAGGDGTLRAVAEGLSGTDTALGILPRGTVNVLARELRLPLDRLDDALEICLSGATRRIDLGRVGDSRFLLMCSAGFDARAVHDVRAEVKELVGARAYALSAMTGLSTFVPPDMKLIVDGQIWHPGEAFMVVIANSTAYAGDFRIAPDAEMEDGLLDVVLFAAPPLPLPAQRAAFLRQIGAVTLTRAAQDPDIHYLRARRIELTSTPATPTQIDGDPLGMTPITVEVIPSALAVRTPS